MPSKRKNETYLWDDESGEPAPFTPEDVNARLEVANDLAEEEEAAAEARFKELDDLLTREEALAKSLYATLQDSIREMNSINIRVAALTPSTRKTARIKRSRSVAATPTTPLP